MFSKMELFMRKICIYQKKVVPLPRNIYIYIYVGRTNTRIL